MIPIPTIEALEPGDVVRHPERGFAVVTSVDAERGRVELRWEGADAPSPEPVDAADLSAGFRLCAPRGFLARSVLDREGLRADAEADPVGTLRELLDELAEPQGRKDIQRLLVERAGLEPVRFEAWWDALRDTLPRSPGFRWHGDQLTFQGTDDDDDGAPRPGLAAVRGARRFRLVLEANRAERGRLLAEAARIGDVEAADLLLACRAPVSEEAAPALLELARERRPAMLVALVHREVKGAVEALAAALSREEPPAGLVEAIGDLREEHRVPFILDLIEHLLPGDPEAAGRLARHLPAPPASILQGIGSGRYAARPGATGWARSIRWLRARADQAPRSAPRTEHVRLPVDRAWEAALAVARALAARHAEGRAGGGDGVRLQLDEAEGLQVHLGPADGGDPRQDVFDAMRALFVALVGPLPPGEHVDADLLLAQAARLAPDLPPEWLAVATRALAGRPERRHADGAELWADLARARAHAEVRAAAPAAAHPTLDIGYDTHIGRLKARVGQVNQDALFWNRRGPVSLLVVADGISVSTAGSGNLASAILVQVISTLWEQHHATLARASEDAVERFLVESLAHANRAICEGSLRLAGGDLSRHIPMGTTVVAAVVRGNRVVTASLGDSRIYLVGPAGVAQLTADHNLRGAWLASWAAGSGMELMGEGHALVGYEGHFDDEGEPRALPPDLRRFTLLPGETLFLCSDGLSDYAAPSAEDLARLLQDAAARPDLEAACRMLVEQANLGGGGDNITVIAARLGSGATTGPHRR